MTLGAGISQVQLPKGFFASGLNCGVRRYRPDLALVTSDVPAVAAGVFTQNTCLGEHIHYCKGLLPSSNIRGIITNSGQANTAVGPVGKVDNFKMADSVAKAIGVETSQVLTASTGVIGQKVEIEKILDCIPALVDSQINSAETFANAIMTTDLVPKSVTMTIELDEGPVRLTGVAKGSGMIHPNMATMLGYVFTDVQLNIKQAQSFLVEAVKPTFNMISVDGEPSTNDSVYLLANGQANVILKSQKDCDLFQQALVDVCTVLAKSIAKDGEGATKLLQVELDGAPSKDCAIQWARSLTVSPLIKTAVHGRDPNWGRIIARLGSEGVPSEALDKMNLSIQGMMLLENGHPTFCDLIEVAKKLKTTEIKINVSLGIGEDSAIAWGCDLSKKYVEINAEYTT